MARRFCPTSRRIFYIVQAVHLIHSLARFVRFGLVIHSDNSFIYPIRLVRFV